MKQTSPMTCDTKMIVFGVEVVLVVVVDGTCKYVTFPPVYIGL